MLHDPRPPQQAARPLDRSGVLALAGALVLLLLIGSASVWQAARNAQALASAQATRTQRNVISNIMLAAEDAETSQRGFLLTLNPAYLEPLIEAEKTLPGLLLILAAQRPDDPMLDEFRSAVIAKLGELRQTVTQAQAGDQAAAIDRVRTNFGNNLMRRIRAYVREREDDLDVALVGQVEAISRGGRLLVAIDMAGLVMILALGGLIALGLRGYVRSMREAQELTNRANETLERSNERLDETVRERTADLTAANEEIQRFAYIVSHDLRAPLVNIMGFTSELEQAAGLLAKHGDAIAATAELKEAVQDEIPEALRFIKSSTSKMDRLINAILKLSREGRRVLVPEKLDMAAMLASMVESMQHQATVKDATIQIGQAPDFVADRLAVEQVFTNVIDNALKYLRPGRPGHVSIQGELTGGMVRYEVSDNGRGIAERDYERVFELFRRAGDQSTPGEGIGLAHVRALVRRLGGTIDCRSTLEVGTTFTIQLPAVARYAMENAA